MGAVSPTRDFSYISDTVDGFVTAMKSHKGSGEFINLGSNFEISIGDTVDLIAEIMRADIKIITDKNRLRPIKSEVDRLWADNTKAKQIFGWSPNYTGRVCLKKGLKETIKWFSDPENIKNYKTNIFNI